MSAAIRMSGSVSEKPLRIQVPGSRDRSAAGQAGRNCASASDRGGAGVGTSSCSGSRHQPTSRQAPNFQPTAG